jgi:hypothetical protein
MSWAKLGKKSRPALAPEEIPGRSTTPTPGNPTGQPIQRSGQISFRCVSRFILRRRIPSLSSEPDPRRLQRDRRRGFVAPEWDAHAACSRGSLVLPEGQACGDYLAVERYPAAARAQIAGQPRERAADRHLVPSLPGRRI